MASGPARPLDHPPGELQSLRESHGRGRLRPSPRPLLLQTRRSAQCHFRPTATTQSLWELLSYGLRLLLVKRRLHLQGRMPSATLLNSGSLIPSLVIRMPDWKRSESSMLSRRATPRCVTSLLADRRSCRPTFWRATPRTSVPPFQTSRSWRVKADTTDDEIVLLVRNPTPSPTRSDKPNSVGRAASNLRSPAHVPLDRASLSFDGLLPPWHQAHVAHAGAVYCWIDMNVCTRWWLRHCLKCQARKTPRMTLQ